MGLIKLLYILGWTSEADPNISNNLYKSFKREVDNKYECFVSSGTYLRIHINSLFKNNY
jgi:hypothetical protein